MSEALEGGPAPTPRLIVWDAPTRLFHWAIVALIGTLWWTGEQRMLDWHRLAGYALTAALLFRLLWGVVGSQTARFASFVRGPRSVMHYVRRDMFRRGASLPVPGHNPVGGWSVVVMLALLAAQVALGMIAVDVDGIESGPLSSLVEFDTGRWAAELHGVVFNVLLGVIALHVLAALFYLLVRRENLIGAMLTGRRAWAGEAPALHFASSVRAILLLALCGGAVWALTWYFGS